MCEVLLASISSPVDTVVFLGWLSSILKSERAFFFVSCLLHSVPLVIATGFTFVGGTFTVAAPWFSSFVVIVGTNLVKYLDPLHVKHETSRLSRLSFFIAIENVEVNFMASSLLEWSLF